MCQVEFLDRHSQRPHREFELSGISQVQKHKMAYFKVPCSILISGPSQSGKSHLVYRILRNLEKVFDKDISEIKYCFSRNQPLFQEMQQNCPKPITLINGLPQTLKMAEHGLLIIDDLMGESYDQIADIFTKDVHHKKFSCIFIVQSLFNKNPFHRIISLNAHFLILLKNPRDKSQIMHFARQFWPENPKYVIDAYHKATNVNYGYLVINFRADVDDTQRLSDSVFPDRNIFWDLKRATEIDLSHSPSWQI